MLTLPLAVVVVCLLALGRDSASSQTVGTAVNVSQSPGTDSEELVLWQPLGSGTPSFAEAFVAWLENDYEDDPDDPDDPSGGVDVCELADPMAPPTECTSLPEAPGNAAFLSAAGAGDSQFVAWEQYTSDIYSGEVRVAHSMDGGDMWSSPETIATNAYRPRLVAHENRVFAGYLDWNTGDAMVREGIRAGNGISWGVPVMIATGMWRMDLFMSPDGTLVIPTANAATLQTNIVADGESLPGEQGFVDDEGANYVDLVFINVETGGVEFWPVLVYTDAPSHKLSVSCYGAGGWGQPAILGVNGTGLRNPKIAASGREVYVAWDARATDRYQIRGRYVGCDDDPPELGQPLLLSDGEHNSFQPQVTINGPRLYVAYNESPVGDDETIELRLLQGRLSADQFEYFAGPFGPYLPEIRTFWAFVVAAFNLPLIASSHGAAPQGGGADDEGAPFLHFFYYQVDAEGQSDIFWRLGLIAGDTDCDAGVDAVDALQVLRETAGLPTGADCLSAGDVNCNGASTAVDALFILRYVAALPVNQPEDCSPIDL